MLPNIKLKPDRKREINFPGSGAKKNPFSPDSLSNLANWLQPQNMSNSPGFLWQDSETIFNINRGANPISIVTLDGYNIMNMTGVNPAVLNYNAPLSFLKNNNYTLCGLMYYSGGNGKRYIVMQSSIVPNIRHNIEVNAANALFWSLSNYTLVSGSTNLANLSGLGFFIIIYTMKFNTLNDIDVTTYLNGSTYTFNITKTGGSNNQTGFAANVISNMQLGEIIVYNDLKSIAEINLLGNYYTNKYPSALAWINI